MVSASAQTQSLSYADRAKKAGSARPATRPTASAPTPHVAAAASAAPSSSTQLPRTSSPPPPQPADVVQSPPATASEKPAHISTGGGVAGLNGTTLGGAGANGIGGIGHESLLSPSTSSGPSLQTPSAPVSKPSTPPKQNVWALRREQMQHGRVQPPTAAHALPSAPAPPSSTSTPSVPASASSSATTAVATVAPAESVPSTTATSLSLAGTPPLSSPTTSQPSLAQPSFAASTKPSSSRSSAPASRVSPSVANALLLHPASLAPPHGPSTSTIAAAAILKPHAHPEAVPAAGPSVTEGLLGDTTAWPEPIVSLQVKEKEKEKEKERASPGEKTAAEGELPPSTSGGGRRAGKKTEWVAIPLAELQAAADAAAQQHAQAHKASSSRSASVAASADRSPHPAGRHRLPPRPQASTTTNNISINPNLLPPGPNQIGEEQYGRRSGRPTPAGSAQRSRRASSSGMRTGPTSIAPSPAHRPTFLDQPGFHTENVIVAPAILVPAPPPPRRRRKASRPSPRAVGVRMPKMVDGQERASGSGWLFAFGSALNDTEDNVPGHTEEVVVESPIVQQRGRFGIGISPPPHEAGGVSPYTTGYGTPGYTSRPESVMRMTIGTGLGTATGNGYGDRGLQFGIPSGASSPEVRSVLGLGDMDLQSQQHARRRSSVERFDQPPSGPRGGRYNDGYAGPPGPNGRGGRGRGGMNGPRGAPYGRGGYRGGGPGGPGGFRNGYGPMPPPPLGGYPMSPVPYDPSDPESYLHPPPGPPPPGPPPHMPGMDLPPIPSYPPPMGPPPWMMGAPSYLPPPPQFVPPYAQPFPPPVPGQPNGIPFGMSTAPVPTPVTLLSFPLDPLRYYLLGQVEYYFSLHNLLIDVFLRNQMDHEGWVDIGVIASFNRMRTLTNDYNLVRETMELSSLVEVRGEQVRLANGAWQQFIVHRTPRQVGPMGGDGPHGSGRGNPNGDADSFTATTATHTAPGSETASGSAATTLSVPEEEGETKESEATP